MPKPVVVQDPTEERANAATHFLGAVLSIFGLLLLLLKVYPNGNKDEILSAWIFGLSLTLLYSASATYHSIKRPALKNAFRVVDHAAIYILIAGTYTPVALVSLQNRGGITLFIIVWSITLVGIVFKLFFTNRFNILSTIFYLGMGWLFIFKFNTFREVVSAEVLLWIIVGGLSYSFGVIFYLARRLRFSHAIWHMFVLVGSLAHFIAIYFIL